MVGDPDDANVEFLALLEQRLVVGLFSEPMVSAPVGGAIAGGVDLQGAAPEPCVEVGPVHARLLFDFVSGIERLRAAALGSDRACTPIKG